MNEAKAKADELQRQLNNSTSQRARAQAESGKGLCSSCTAAVSMLRQVDARCFYEIIASPNLAWMHSKL